MAFAGAIPIIVAFTLMAGFRVRASVAMAAGWALAASLGLGLWRMEPRWLAASAAYGALQALDVIIIVFGAILLMNHLNRSGAISTIRGHITTLIADRRAQVLLIGMGFMMVIEGVADFGTPGALAAPLLIGLGFPPLAAAVMGLVFNAAQPPFGAAGTPVIGGVGAVIDDSILDRGMELPRFLQEVSGWTGVVTGATTVFWGLLGVFLLLLWFGHDGKRSLRGAFADLVPVAPFGLTLGIIGGATQFLVAWLVGPELPDIASGFVVLGIGSALAHRGILQPREPWTFEPSARWPAQWLGGLEAKPAEDGDHDAMPIYLAWLPYALVALVLLVTRWPGLGIAEWLRSQSLDIPAILGEDLSYSLRYLYLPGIMPFIPVVVLTAFLHRMRASDVLCAWKESGRQLLSPSLTVIIAVSMTQIMIQSTVNTAGVPGMMDVLSSALARGAGAALPLAAPWIGALGAFMTGSNTSSNILFSAMQHDASAAVGVSRTIVVALQNVGGGIGNMVSILNIAAISGVIGLKGKEGDILRKTLVPTAIFALVAGTGGWLLTLVFSAVY